MFVKDGPDTEAPHLLKELVTYGKEHRKLIILEGILNLEWYYN